MTGGGPTRRRDLQRAGGPLPLSRRHLHRAALRRSGRHHRHEFQASTAAAHALPVTAYQAAQPATEFATALKAAHPRGVVLIAGHSNTVPGIVAALCNCETAPMADHEYDRLSSIQFDADGRARLDSARYGAASPAP